MKIKNLRLLAVMTIMLSSATGLAVPTSPGSEPASASGMTDISTAVIVKEAGSNVSDESLSANVLSDEIKKRTGLDWKVTSVQPEEAAAIVLKISAKDLPREGFSISKATGSKTVSIQGGGKRGLLYGVGAFLRMAKWTDGHIEIPSTIAVTESPAYKIRGHQLGYRDTSNTYDAWDDKQFDQYIRELVLFGANSIEGIPSTAKSNVLMKTPIKEMNINISRICDKYDVDFWIWITASIDLKNEEKRKALAKEMEEYFKAYPRLDGIFLAGGDPGDNEPSEVMPYLEGLAKTLRTYHPDAGVWVSLQGFSKAKTDWFFDYVVNNKPQWLTGVVHGPQSPSLADTRARLPENYLIRLYPDVCHSVLCQFPVAWWDPACARTEGREFVKPRPQFYTYVHNRFAPDSDGFIGYSDGVNDDVNKFLWCILSWKPETGTREALIDYSKFFFGPAVAIEAADLIAALEENWNGPAELNGSIDIVWKRFQDIENHFPALRANWRWRLLAMRAAYDSYVRTKLIYDTALEKEALKALGQAASIGSEKAMDNALSILNRANPDPEFAQLRARIEKDGEDLFNQIGIQTSVDKYHTANFERCAVLDFLDRPLNDKWWLEDQFQKIRGLKTEAEKITGLETLRTWDCPVPGSSYDIVGDIAHNPHVMRGEPTMLNTDDLRGPLQTFGTWLGLKNRWRMSWLSSYWPSGMVYEGLDPNMDYVVRARGSGDALLSINGVPVQPSVYSKEQGGLKEFPVPREAVKNIKITLKWERPAEEAKLNWRKQSNLSEVWLVPVPRDK